MRSQAGAWERAFWFSSSRKKSMMSYSVRSHCSVPAWLLILVLVTLTSNVSAHPFHISIAEVEYNAKSARYEVSLKIHVSDLERAISATAERNVNIAKDQEADKLLTDYLNEHFFLTSTENLQDNKEGNQHLKPGAEHSKVHFIGKEIEATWLWLYVELEYAEPAGTKSESTIARSEDLDNLLLVNTILLDVTDAQINTVSFRDKNKKHSFKTTLKQPWAKIPKLSQSK
jgi:hypothetical protein